MERNKFDPPVSSTADTAFTATKGLMSMIPFVGGGITTLVDIIYVPPVQKRLQEWREYISASLECIIDNKGITFEELRNNDHFIDIVSQATLIAIRTSEKTKIDSLKYAVLNSVFSNIDKHKQQIFLTYVDSFTDWHLEVLTFFSNPHKWLNNKGIDKDFVGDKPPIALFREVLNTEGDSNVFFQILNDLFSRGLLITDNRNILSRKSSMYDKRTSEFGDEFIDFVMSDPAIS